jgi:hypothetical protein
VVKEEKMENSREEGGSGFIKYKEGNKMGNIYTIIQK